MKKIAYLTIPLLAAFLGCNSNSETAKVKSSADSANQTAINNDTLTADNTVHTNAASHLAAFLRKYYQEDLDKNLLDSNSKKFTYSEYDLNQDGKMETFIGLTGSYFCGSGGCTALLLDNNGKLLTRFTVARYPFTISSLSTNSWKDLLVESAGKQHVLKFNGKTYPSNPSVQPEFKGDLSSGDQVLKPEPWHKF